MAAQPSFSGGFHHTVHFSAAMPVKRIGPSTGPGVSGDTIKQLVVILYTMNIVDTKVNNLYSSKTKMSLEIYLINGDFETIILNPLLATTSPSTIIQ